MFKLAGFIKEKRAETTLRAFAALCGVSAPYILDIEAGAYARTGRITAETITKIAAATGASVVEVFSMVLEDFTNERVKNLKSGREKFSFLIGHDFDFYKKHKLPVPDILEVIRNCEYSARGKTVSAAKKKQIYNVLVAFFGVEE